MSGRLSSRGAAAGCNGGFTLIELLISISILGLISVVSYSAIWTASRSLQAVEQSVELHDGLRVTQEFFRQAVSQARTVMTIVDGRVQVLFSGDVNTLIFVAPAPMQRGAAGGLYRYRFDLTRVGATSQPLRLSYWPYLAGVEIDEALAPQGETLLLENMEELRFSYYGSDEPGAPGEWLTEWTRTDSLPKLIRMVLKNTASEETSSLTVAIKGGLG